ncbi:TMEM165/GDT1 family protein [Sphingomonas hylomeconis]|uniref:GDT1 family protein n=1 Tax=Sphingomonas hylomeconis TaxID=1395958 RepID=A0ABV7SPV0_9SPHN|nr:TMEM165/GDT1 family protein [Sphingomonas hylomeconis]
MDALMAALVAAALAQASDRTPWLAAILGDRYPRVTVILATALALALGNTIAAIGGTLVAREMSPNARDLFLAIALIFSGIAAFSAIKPPDRLTNWRLGAFPTSLAGVFVLALGDRSQFLTAAITARSPAPVFAAIGATIGALAINVPAILAGEAARRRLPITAVRIGAGALFLLIGVYLALGAIRLI